MYLVVIHLGYTNHVASLYNVSLCCVVSLNIINSSNMAIQLVDRWRHRFVHVRDIIAGHVVSPHVL